MVDLNHIFLFLAVVSPLLVLARAWRPGAPYHGWRVAALVVLALTAAAWILTPTVAGYIGCLAWIVLLFLPAVGLRKMTELAAYGNYKSAAKLGTILQILHPSAELRDQVQLFRHLESHQDQPVAFVSIPRAQRVRQGQIRGSPAVLALILLNAVAFLFEISVGDLNDPDVLHRVGALEPYAVLAQGEYWRLFTALFLHGGFYPSSLQRLRALYSWSAVGTIHRNNPIRRLLFGVRTCIQCGCCGFDCNRSRTSLATRWRVGLYHGNRRRVGRISIATSSCAARKTTLGERRNDHRGSSCLRPFNATDKHGGAPVWTNRRLLSWSDPRAASCSCGRCRLAMT